MHIIMSWPCFIKSDHRLLTNPNCIRRGRNKTKNHWIRSDQVKSKCLFQIKLQNKKRKKARISFNTSHQCNTINRYVRIFLFYMFFLHIILLYLIQSLLKVDIYWPWETCVVLGLHCAVELIVSVNHGHQKETWSSVLAGIWL